MPYLNIPHGRVFYSSVSPSLFPPTATLILHHGLGATHAYYRSITPILTSAPYNVRCISYDVISSGLSDPASGSLNVQSLAEDVIAVLDALEVKEKAIMVGHSMGGLIAGEVASTKGDRIQAAVMLGPALPGPAMADALGARIKLVESEGMEAVADTVPTGATGSKSTPLQHAFIRALLLSQKPENYCSLVRVVTEATPPKYESIEMPTLMIAADEDKSTPLAACEEMYGRMGGHKSMEVMTGVGHWYCIEAPEGVARIIGEFVNKTVN